jgi:aspartate 1-decarboxylase
MQISMLKCKIHRATVTDANLNYEGSISIDPKLSEANGFRLMSFRASPGKSA